MCSHPGLTNAEEPEFNNVKVLDPLFIHAGEAINLVGSDPDLIKASDPDKAPSSVYPKALDTEFIYTKGPDPDLINFRDPEFVYTKGLDIRVKLS